MVKILIADDHEIFRKGIKQILSEMPEKFVVDEAKNGQEVMEKMWGNNYRVVLLDISMPGRNGLDILKQVKSYKRDLQVLILSMYPEEQFAVRALKAGAAGYLTKACKPDELVTAVQNVLKGKKYISSSLSDRLALYVGADERRSPHETLSTREYEVMCMTAAGKPVKQIAMELSLSDKTISTYRSRILDKLNISNIAQLIQYAIQNRVLDQLHNKRNK
jgi:DNA-binding NarL/FixJ family response regulator